MDSKEMTTSQTDAAKLAAELHRHANYLPNKSGSTANLLHRAAAAITEISEKLAETKKTLTVIANIADPDGGPDCQTCVRILVLATESGPFLTAEESKELRSSQAFQAALDEYRSGGNLVERAEAAERRLAAVEAALRRYGQHDGDYAMRTPCPVLPCTCGYEAALAGETGVAGEVR